MNVCRCEFVRAVARAQGQRHSAERGFWHFNCDLFGWQGCLFRRAFTLLWANRPATLTTHASAPLSVLLLCFSNCSPAPGPMVSELRKKKKKKKNNGNHSSTLIEDCYLTCGKTWPLFVIRELLALYLYEFIYVLL